jgi:predicted acetyltransferase
MMIFLTEPGIKYQRSFLTGLREFHQEGRMLQYNLQVVSNDFESFLYHLRAQQDPAKLPPHSISQSHFWLVNDSEFIGILSLRSGPDNTFIRISGHIGYQIRPSQRRRGYGKQLLHLGLQKAKELGFTRVLLTCDEDNIASKKIIEYNGGQFENAIQIEGSPVKKLRYWIDLDQPKHFPQTDSAIFLNPREKTK